MTTPTAKSLDAKELLKLREGVLYRDDQLPQFLKDENCICVAHEYLVALIRNGGAILQRITELESQLEAARGEVAKLRNALDVVVLDCGVRDIDPRIKYIELQIDRTDYETLKLLREQLSAKEGG